MSNAQTISSYPQCNRISKNVNGKETWYVRDASGNVLSVYTKDAAINNGNLTQSEVDMYGSSRLGILNRKIDVTLNNIFTGPGSHYYISYTRGKKFFELSNHLGNVLTVVSDRKKPFAKTTNQNVVDFYFADIKSVRDYYPFGMEMPGRAYSIGSSKYGFNGKRKDNEIYGEGNFYDYGMRGYDSRLGKFWGVDPISKKYPWYSPYQYAGNSPIKNIDIDGLEPGGNQSDWEIVPGSVTVYTALHITSSGKTVIATATQMFVKESSKKYAGWVTHYTWDETSNGLTVKANDYSWYNEDEKIKLPAKDVGRWQRFETDIIKEQKGNWQMADNIGKATFGVAAILSAAPAASYLGGPLLKTSFSQTSLNVGLTKAFIGGVADALAQKTTYTDAPINLWSVGASALFSNPFFSSMIGSALSINTNGNIQTSSIQNIAVNTIVGGSLGASLGKLGIPYQTRSKVRFGDAALRGGLNLISDYWSGVANNVISEKAVNLFDNNKK